MNTHAGLHTWVVVSAPGWAGPFGFNFCSCGCAMEVHCVAYFIFRQHLFWAFSQGNHQNFDFDWFSCGWSKKNHTLSIRGFICDFGLYNVLWITILQFHLTHFCSKSKILELLDFWQMSSDLSRLLRSISSDFMSFYSMKSCKLNVRHVTRRIFAYGTLCNVRNAFWYTWAQIAKMHVQIFIPAEIEIRYLSKIFWSSWASNHVCIHWK